MPGLLLQPTPTETYRKPKDPIRLRDANRFLPALRLCHDVLEYLFLLGASLANDPFLKHRTVLSYAQTCHDWRRAALSSKFLWVQLTDFDFMPWSWNQEMLRRSHPLHVVMGSFTYLPRSISTVEAELAYLERIKTYRLGFTHDTWDVLVGRLQFPAEQMEYLSLAHVPLRSNKFQSWLPYDGAARFILPSTLFASSAPNLRHLKLEGCFVDHQTPLLSQITHFEVIDIDTRYNTALTSEGWVDLFGRMPHLRKLRLKNAIYSAASPLRSKRREIALASSSDPSARSAILKRILPNLADLSIEGVITEVAALLDGIEIPAGCDISLVCKECHGGGDDLNRILRGSLKSLALQLFSNRVGTTTRSSTAFPLLIYANGSTLQMRVDEGVLCQHALELHPRNDSDAGESLPNFQLTFHASRNSCWQSILSPLLFALSDSALIDDQQLVISDSMASKITSLELTLPSPHLDLIPFLALARNVEALINLPGYFGGWLVGEMYLWTARGQSSESTEAGDIGPNISQSMVMLPRLRVLSFGDDRCLYHHRWKSLETFLKSRTPLSTTPGIQRIIFRNSLPLEDKVDAITSLGIAVDWY